ncbi:MAG: hypothetical protein JW943_03560 [Deltaproteobacteria bacterium]|nr:hypothetical protein [Deltaproteobacteria bacterium]
MKTKLSIVVCVTVLCCWIMAIGVSHAAKTGDPDMIWGTPAGVVKTASGSEMRYYTVVTYDSSAYRVFEIDNGQVIDKGLSPTMP